MKNSFALGPGTTSGLGHAAAGLLATKGYREVIVTGRSLARVQETAAQLALAMCRRWVGRSPA